MYTCNSSVLTQQHEGPPGFIFIRRTSWIFVSVCDLTIMWLSLAYNSAKKRHFHRSACIWFDPEPRYYLSLLITWMWKHFSALYISKGITYEHKKQYSKWKISAWLFKNVWQGTFSELKGLGVPDGRNRVCKYSISSSMRVRLWKKQNNLEMNLWENWQESRWQGSLINHFMKKTLNVW